MTIINGLILNFGPQASFWAVLEVGLNATSDLMAMGLAPISLLAKP